MTDAVELIVEPVAAVPGERVEAAFVLENRTGDPCLFAVAVGGIEAGWVAVPAVVGPVPAGASVSVPIVVTLPHGHPATELLGSIEVRPLDAAAAAESPAAPSAVGTVGANGDRPRPGADGEDRVVRRDLRVLVGSGMPLSARIEPHERTGGRSGRFTVVLRSRTGEAQPVELRASAPDPDLRVGFHPRRPVVLPGRETTVTATVRVRRPLRGSPRRHPFAVTATGRGRPLHLDAAYTARPWLPAWAGKSGLLLAVLALWGAVAVVGIHALSSHIHRTAVSQQPSASSAAPSRPGSTSTGPSSGAAAGTSGTSPSTAAPGAAAAGAKSTASATTTTVSGTVTGTSPGGATVTLAPTSLADPATLDATVLGNGPSVRTDAAIRSSRAPGMVYATAATGSLLPGLSSAATPTLTTTSAPDGAFVFAGVHVPGTYLLTVAKAGFTTRRYVVQAQQPAIPVTVTATLRPGTGSLSGTTDGPAGPLGGVTVTVTDGTVTLTTRTPSTGSGVGTWSISGLSTPDTYLVSASAPGYGTQTTSVDLGPSASAAGVDLTLAPNVGSISGTVTAAASGQPLGGITVAATSGATTVKATTATTASVGHFLLPNLATPATWTLTVSGAGYQTQTEQIALSGNQTTAVALAQSGANLTGVVTAQGGAGLGNVGLTLANATATFKALTQTVSPVGGYEFPQVPPGTYVLTATLFGYGTESTTVTLTAGETTTSDLALPVTGPPNLDTGTITGTVQNSFTGAALAGVPISLDGHSTGATTNAQGQYALSDVGPGVHAVSAVGTGAGYTTASVQVTLGVGGSVVAPIIGLAQLGTITGQILDATTGAPLSAPPPGCSASSITPAVSLLEGGQPVGPPVSVTVTSAGSFTISNVPAGSYVVQVQATCFVTTQVAATVALGQQLSLTVTLSTVPSFTVQTVQSQNGGSPSPVSGVCVVVVDTTDSSLPPDVATTGSDGKASFGGLVANDAYLASFALLAPGSTCDQQAISSASAEATAQSHAFTAEPNATAVYTAFLTPVLQPLSVTLVFPYAYQPATAAVGATEDCPVSGSTAIAAGGTGGSGSPPPCPTGLPAGSGLSEPIASGIQVALTGTTGYQTSTSGQVGSPINSTVVAAGPAGADDDVWSFSNAQVATFVSTQATLTVSSDAFSTLSVPVTLPTATSGSAAITEVLTPRPVPVTGAVSPASGVTLVVSPGQLVPSSTPGSANTLATATTITASETSGGGLTWSDPATGQANGTAEPGLYQVTLSAAGYAPNVETVAVPLCASATVCAGLSLSLSLVQLVSLEVAPVPATIPSGLAPLTATLECASTTAGSSPVTVAAQSLGSSGTASFGPVLYPAGTTPPNGCSGSYTVVVSGEGIATFTSPTLDLSQATGSPPTLTVSPSLTDEGYLTLTVDGAAYAGGAATALAGATVTASLLVAGSCSTTGTSAYAPVVTATTGANGTAVVVPTSTGPTIPNGGLCVGGSYTVQVSATGYLSTTETTTVTTGDTVLGTVNLVAAPIHQELDVYACTQDLAVTVTPTSSFTTVPAQTLTAATVASNPPQPCPGTAPTYEAVFSFELPPVQWTFVLSAPDYENLSVGPVGYEVGESASPIEATLMQDLSTVQGAITVAAGPTGTSSTAISSLPLTLLEVTGSTTQTVETTTTASNGSYSFPKQVPPGAYEIEVGGDYLLQSTQTATSQPFSTNFPNPTVQNVTVYAPAVVLNVALSVPQGVTDTLNGATVTLTPTTSTTPPSCPSGDALLASGLGSAQTATAATSSSGATAQFTDVVPDLYALSVSGSGIPAQTPQDVIVCPGETSPTTASYTVEEGEVSGTVTVELPTTATTVTVTVSASAGGQTTSTTCSASGSGSTPCSYSLDTPLATVALSAEAAGYTEQTGSASLSSASPTATFSPTLPQNQVSVTVSANGAPAVTTEQATVVLRPSTGSSLSSTTDTTGTATFAAVPAGTYSVVVTPNLQAAQPEDLGSVTVAATSTTVTASPTLSTAPITGTISNSGTSSITVTVTIPLTATVGSATTATCASVSVPGGGSTPYTCTVPEPSSAAGYTLTFSPSSGASTTLTVPVTSASGVSGQNVSF